MFHPSFDLIGKTLGRYQVQQSIGKGGMAEVFKAYDPQLDRSVALKIIHFRSGDPDIYLRRFEREAKALARLSHPHIVKVYEYGRLNGIPYLVMEYLAGGTLKDRLNRRFGWAEAAGLLLPIARALDYAHSHSIIHRDVKPANILFNESGDPLLSDFGIIKLIGGEEQTSLTESGIVIGTSDYMPPEQWTGSASPQTDIYALGVIFFQMIMGRLPYPSASPAERVIHQILDTLPNPREIIPDLPLPVEEMIRKTLAKNPQERYPTAKALAQALEAIGREKAGEGPVQPPKPVAPKAAAPNKVRPAAVAVPADSPQSLALSTGARFGRYRILEPLGKKQTALKFRVQDTLLERAAVLQVFPHLKGLPPAALSSFKEEAALLSSLVHPNISRLVDYGVEGGVPFLVTEYAASVSLGKHIGKPIPWQDVVKFLEPAANALAAAHQKGILHRQLSPAAILISDSGAPVVTDFALPSLTAAVNSQVNDFHAYASPEQAAGEEYDARADIYALGAIFFEMLSGKKPYSALSAPALVYQQMTQPLPDLRQTLPDLPAVIDDILKKSLAKDPADRYPEMNDLIIEFRLLLEQAAEQARLNKNAQEEAAKSAALTNKKPRRLTRFLRLSLFTLFLLLAAVLIAYVYTMGSLPWQGLP